MLRSDKVSEPEVAILSDASCRTAKHVARLFSVPEKDVRRAAKAFTKLEEPELAVEAEKALRYAG